MRNQFTTLLRVVLCAAAVSMAPLSAVHAVPCVVPDNGSGTVTLPPAGCAYLSPADVHEIVAGLPAGTTVVLTGMHHQFACGGAGTPPPAACSFVPSPACQQTGGSLGGEMECADSTLSLNLQGTGTLSGWNRSVQVPVSFETHVGPRVPGAPIQQFPTDMHRLQGQLPPGDPDFDLLRITGGTSNGMPSPGLTKLTQLGANWSVDSFFDITYRIDFIGRPGGHLGGMSGSTTATIRMATGTGTPCVPATCDDGNPCTTDACDTATGTCNNIQISCDDGQICTDDFCNPATGLCSHAPTSCDDGNPCTLDNCSQALLAPQCIVPDNGGGTVTLPPAGCDYLSPSDVHEIVSGLPPGTTIQLGAIHRKFICGSQPASVCSFGPPIPGVDCDDVGGSLGGEKECAESELQMTLHGTGALAGWNRTIMVPLSFETHTGPRTPGQPVQSFDTDMFRMFGQITNPGSGDPDFDLLRIVGGTDFGLPSPGHTTLRSQGGGNFAVDSFFDITYRIDFVGRVGGHVAGMSGSTTGTIRMQVGQGVGCTHTPVACDDGNPCTDDVCDPVLGCVFTNDDTNACSDGNACTNDVCSGGACVCPSVTGACTATTAHFDAAAPEVPKPILATAANVVTSSLTVSGVGPHLYDLNARTFITHTSSGQLQITLRSPAGTIVSLTTQNGGTNDNVFNGTLWDDDADPGNQVPYASPLAASTLATDTVYANLAVEATLAPEEPLAAFIGENPNGVWTLTIADLTTLDGGTLANWSLDVATLSAPPVSTPVSYPSSDVPKTITVAAPPQVVTSVVSVLGAGTQIGRVRLTTSITHSWVNDLDFTLRSPSGTIVTIGTDNPTASSIANVYNGTLWDDKADPGNQVPYVVPFAASSMVTDSAYTTNVVKTRLSPEEALGAFIGEDPNGPWTLTISDDASGDGGALNAWSLEITTTVCSTTLCAVNCDDGNPCTDDSCSPDVGCVHTPNTNACNDGNLCTVGDVCSGGFCAGTDVNCDDGNVCTNDACIPATGACGYTMNNNACDDGNPCTIGDTCGPVPTTLLSQNFDGVVSPALPAGWVSTQNPVASTPWTTTAAFSVSPPNSATTDTPTSVSDKTLDSPAFVGGFGMVLTFDNSYNLEFGAVGPVYYDGAVLEIKIGAGAFTDVVTAGGSFVLGGYTGPISAGFASPIAGRPAWSAASTGFVPTQVNLPASAAGQTVVLRWRVASDSSAAAAVPNGQWIDNVLVTGNVAGCQGTPNLCDDGNACTDDSCAQTLLAPNCTVTGAGGTVTLPPAGCDYLSPSDVHEIIAGLPAGTTIEFTGIHRDFVCRAGTAGGNCSFVPPPGTCEQPGGNLGGHQECSDSSLGLALHGTGALAGWNRTLSLPVSFETHVGPRVPGTPVQSFDTQMFALQGQLPPGDPDFDLLRITAGNGFGMPSPGHTTLRFQGGNQWHVDSFFDITYRIDFVGAPGGHVGGMSGSTTGTIRMATGSGDPCVHVPTNCDDGNPCTIDSCDPVSGCVHAPVTCDDGQICTVDACDPGTGLCTHSPLNCDDGDACTADSCIQALVAPACVVPDNGGGTVTLPPAGCDYLSPDDVHEIIDGLPAGTTIQLGAIHKDFICHRGPAGGGGVCSFSTLVDCDEAGGSLGGEKECSDSNLALTINGTGVLNGFNRTIQLPISFETHTGPRTPGNPVQSFDTDMFRLFGQITNPGSGDPDFDLLRIVAGTDFGLPSPGHTTLTQMGPNWEVDSFFDITYRIDFVGRPGGALSGMSGSTTGTIRMQTGNGVGCVHSPIVCNDNNPCTNDSCDSLTGCVFINNTNACDDGNNCTAGDTCGGGACTGTPITAPPEAQTVLAAADKTTFSWAPTPFATRYDVLRGSLSNLPVGPGGGDEICFDDLPGPTVNDASPNPAPNTGRWFLSRGENACGSGIYGFTKTGIPRISTTCP